MTQGVTQGGWKAGATGNGAGRGTEAHSRGCTGQTEWGLRVKCMETSAVVTAGT